MHEVSCRALEIFFACLKRNGRSPEEFVAGLPMSLAQLQTPDNWIDWSTYVELIGRLKPLCPTPQHWVDLGLEFTRSNQLLGLNSIYRLIASPRAMAKWGFKFGGHRIFRNIKAHLTEEGEDLIAELIIEEPHQPCPEYFYICHGTFRAMPTVLGFPEVPVELELRPRSAILRNHYGVIEPKGWRRAFLSSWLTQLRRSFGSRKSLISEFERNQLLLEERYSALETAKGRIEDQQAVLQVVHEITTAVHERLRLADTASVVAEQIKARLRYDAVRVSVETVQDEVKMSHHELRGSAELLAANPWVQPLVSNDKGIGTITVGRVGGVLSEEDREVLRAVAESTSLALNNAIAYEVIATYRTDLEAKVLTRTRELAEARDGLARSLESRNRFFANVNHELRSPLTVLLLTVDHLTNLSDLPGAARERLGSMQRNAERLQGLVDDLLMLSAGAEVQQQLRLVEVDSEKLVLDVVESLRPLAEAKGLSLRAVVHPGLKIEGDARQLERALHNLVSNALKYTDAGFVEVSVAPEGELVLLTVKDTGMGIPEAYLPRIFERFVQVPLTSSRPGAGIGLALVKEIASQHNGSVAATSTHGVGSSFLLRVPGRANEALRASARAQPRIAEFVPPTVRPPEAAAPVVSLSRGSTSNSSASRVLLCEDNPDLLAGIAKLLENAGLNVHCVSSAAEALEAAAKFPPDLLLTDLNLGEGMTGIDLCRAFREVKGHNNAPSLILTASPVSQNRLDAFDAGAVDYLLKPFNPLELIARVRAQLAMRTLSLKLMSTERLAAQGAALAGVAHELRNPLNGLINAVGPLRESLPAETMVKGSAADELLGVIEECGQRVATLSHELLFYTRTDLQPIDLHPLNEVAARAVKVMATSLRSVTLRTGFQYFGKVRCSSTQLSQVIMNLLENAVDAAGPGGCVELNTLERGDFAVLEVTDTGPGVPAHLRERIFEPFFTTKPPGKGTGLGLSISRDIVRRHGGNLDVRGALEGQGCAMQLSLPAVRGDS